VDVEALLQLGERDFHDHMVGTISFSALEAADLDKVWASPFCIVSVTHHMYPFSVHQALVFRKTASQIHFNGQKFS
jgi:hypothetical protein